MGLVQCQLTGLVEMGHGFKSVLAESRELSWMRMSRQPNNGMWKLCLVAYKKKNLNYERILEQGCPKELFGVEMFFLCRVMGDLCCI